MRRALEAVVGLFVGVACAPDLDLNYGVGTLPIPSSCRPGIAPHEVRGTEPGQPIDVTGVVTLALSLEPDHAGFFLQSLEDDPAAVGAGVLFVAWAGKPPATGTRVHARGTLGERAGLDELQAVEQLDECGAGPVSPRTIDARELQQLDAANGRWVRAQGDWRLIDLPASPADGRMTASPHGRVFASGHALANAETTALWTLRPTATDSKGEDPSQRLGAALGEIEGVLSVQGQARQLFTARPPAWPLQTPPAPPRPAGSGLRIVSSNLDNYFVSLGSRGARSADDLSRQRDALVALFVALDADILALTELENRSADSLVHLLEGLDRALPVERRYAFEEAPAPSGSVLRAGIAFRPGRVRARGAAWFSAARGFRRAPLFQAFTGDGLSFTLGVVHLTSKRCAEDPMVVPSEGCGEEVRRREAELLLEAARSMAASAPLDPLLLLGDFNADAREAPLELLARGGLGDLLAALPAADGYSYVFEGRASLLDHALAPRGFDTHVRGVAIWHINADEPRAGVALHASTASPRGSSDHDPIIIDLKGGDIRPRGL